jgi:hypothetical protein
MYRQLRYSSGELYELTMGTERTQVRELAVMPWAKGLASGRQCRRQASRRPLASATLTAGLPS